MIAEMLREIEMNRKLVDFLLSEIQDGRDVIIHLSELLECCLRAVQNEKEDLDRDFWLSVSSKSKTLCTEWLQKTNEPEFAQLYESFLLFEARNRVLDSYLLYLEKDRQDKDRFYLPRRKCFLKIGLIQALQDMLDDKLDILSISLPPGTGKTTLEKMFHSAVCGWFPNDYNLFWSHSADITRMYYDGVLDILLNDAEYNWHEIFPEHIVSNTNAKLEQINIDKYKPFPNVQTTSVGASNAGKVRASKFLLCDDFIGSMEQALNKNYLDKLWNIYAVDSRQRKVTGCKEIHIATRWSVHDVIGRLQRMYEGNERCRFIAVPDIDPETNESNFAFDVNPFTVEFYNDQAKVMDEVSYRCLYKNEPIEREGLLYTEESIRRYYSLPNREPDEILGQVDAKGKGTDFMVMPVLYRYGEDYYCVDCVCNKNSDYEVQYEDLANMIVHHRVNNCEFESNMGGDRVAMEVNKRVEKKGWICNITDWPTESNKEARIYQCSNWIKQHILFRDKNDYMQKSDYGNMMSELLSYSVEGKNPNDDVCDVFANFALKIQRREGSGKIEVFDRSFLGF